MDIDVQSVCGEDIISRDAGLKIRNLILESWDHDKIRILVKGRVIASVSFFDEAIGLLTKKSGKSWPKIRAKLEFPDLTPEDRALLNSVIRTRLEEHR